MWVDSTTVPEGWRETNRAPDRITLRCADGREQVTISRLDFETRPSFEEFQKLCRIRIDTERRELKDGFIDAKAPIDGGHRFTLMYFGGDRASGRVFSAYLAIATTRLVTIYVEGVGISPERHIESFKTFGRASALWLTPDARRPTP